MPELYEVRFMTKSLNKLLKGQIIFDIIIHGGQFLKKKPILKEPVLVEQVKSKGKVIYFLFDNETAMTCTLGMTGYWHIKEQIKHDHLSLDTEIGTIWYNDIRRFGKINVISMEELKKYLDKNWGPEIDQISKDEYVNRLVAKKSQPIMNVLVDQKLMSGEGNYMRAEHLYLAKINPHRTIDSLSSKELNKLFDSLQILCTRIKECKGASMKDYRDIYNERSGSYYKEFLVYNRDTDPKSNIVHKEKDSKGRMIHWVPSVQK